MNALATNGAHVFGLANSLAGAKYAERDAPAGGHCLEMWAVYRTDSPPGPAGRWFIDRLQHSQAPPLARELARPQPVSVARKKRALGGD
jgi:DNA-binding transcriptional LysR family regulator